MGAAGRWDFFKGMLTVSGLLLSCFLGATSTGEPAQSKAAGLGVGGIVGRKVGGWQEKEPGGGPGGWAPTRPDCLLGPGQGSSWAPVLSSAACRSD